MCGVEGAVAWFIVEDNDVEDEPAPSNILPGPGPAVLQPPPGPGGGPGFDMVIGFTSRGCESRICLARWDKASAMN